MTDNTPLWKTSIERDEHGRFAHKDYGAKKLRSMQLSDYAWDTFKELADKQGISRTDVIEEFARADICEQTIVLKALQNFIELKRATRGKNQFHKEFSTDTRDWRMLNEFIKLVEVSPWDVGLSE